MTKWVLIVNMSIVKKKKRRKGLISSIYYKFLLEGEKLIFPQATYYSRQILIELWKVEFPSGNILLKMSTHKQQKLSFPQVNITQDEYL